MKKKLLITGSGGFIMSNFIRKAIYENHPFNIVSIDNVEKTSVMNNIYSNKNHQFYIGDVSNHHFLNIIFELEKPDIVIHGAAETSDSVSLKNTDKFINSNILATQVMLDMCIKHNVEKIVFTSTDKVYGPITEGSSKEEAPINPYNLYSASKAAAELLLSAASKSYGIKYNIVRSSNNYGPRQIGSKFIPLVIKNISNNSSTKIYQGGQQSREWLHVQDNCSAILDIINKGQDNEIYNISSNHEFSTIEVFNEIANILGKGHNLIEFDNNAEYHAMRYSSDSRKIRNLGWKPSFKFKDGLRHTISWYINNSWYLKL